MAQLEIIGDAMSVKTKRVKFVRNTCYKGVDYGPDYAEQVVDVEEGWAAEFLHLGLAEEVKAKATPAGVVDNRDPRGK
jgi:hypothetical protein